MGATYEVALRNSRVSGRTFRLWIARFNELGIDGLVHRPGCGRRRKLEPHIVTEQILPLVDGPSLAGHTHWTLTKLCGYLREEKQPDLCYARKIPRRMPKPLDREAWEIRREDFATELAHLLADTTCEVFSGDEAGFEGDPRPRQKWVERGTRPVQGHHGGHLRRSVIGVVNPGSGQLVSLIVLHCDTEVFQVFLDTMAGEAPPGKGRRLLPVLDNASWHKTTRLDWHHIEPVYLPPYGPDFNPIERLWQHLKSHHLAGFVTRDGQALEEQIFQAIRSLLQTPQTIRSVCRTHSG